MQSVAYQIAAKDKLGADPHKLNYKRIKFT